MRFIGEYTIDPAICDRLVELHRVCDRQGLVKRGGIGRADATVVDLAKKDSYDLTVSAIPDDLHDRFGVPAYYQALQGCVEQYLQQHPVLAKVGMFKVTESPAIQHYRPGGGFKLEHFERTGLATTTRMLVWMTFLNDVDDGAGRDVRREERPHADLADRLHAYARRRRFRNAAQVHRHRLVQLRRVAAPPRGSERASPLGAAMSARHVSARRTVSRAWRGGSASALRYRTRRRG